MLDKLPFEIKLEIMKRLPVKSIVQFRSVSKPWKSLIDCTDFVARYSALQAEPQHLLVIEYNIDDEYIFYIISDDDETFPQQRTTFTTENYSNFPPLLNWLRLSLTDYRSVGSSHGLVCLYGDRREGRGGHSSLTAMAVIWNPSIRKAVGVIVPNLGDCEICWTVVGFGVCGETMDPKIVKIKYIKEGIDAESVSSISWQVEVFTLSTGSWRSPYRNLPRKSILFGYGLQVVVSGFLYWLTTDKITMDGGYNKSYNLIVSFNMTTEEFREVNLPDNLALARHNDNHILQINQLRNSLVVIDHNQDANNPAMDIWTRVDGVFTKLFNLKVNTQYGLVWGFRKNGAPIVDNGKEFGRELVVYEPNSKNMDSFWVRAIPSKAFVYPYMETLLLLDQPDLMIYNDISMWRADHKRILKHTS